MAFFLKLKLNYLSKMHGYPQFSFWIPKPGFHIIAPVATVVAVVEKRVSATVAIYGNTLFSDSSDKYDSGDELR